MTYTEFQKAWREAVIRFLSGEITEDELLKLEDDNAIHNRT